MSGIEQHAASTADLNEKSTKEKVSSLKKVHYAVSLLLFVVTFTICSLYARDLKLTHISLSHFGIYQKIGLFWNASLFVIALTLFVEAYQNIEKYMPKSKLLYIFAIAIVCLLFTASINMKHRIHYYAAYVYFIGYTLGIFVFGLKLIKSNFRLAMSSIAISLTSVIVPISLIMYLHSLAIPELAHTFLIFSWITITRFEHVFKDLLKRIGL